MSSAAARVARYTEVAGHGDDEPQRPTDPGAGARLRALLIAEGAIVPLEIVAARVSGREALRLDRAGRLEAVRVIRDTAPTDRMLATVASNPAVPLWLREALCA